jgi:hypothetical protein
MSDDAASEASTLGAVAKSDDDGAPRARSREQDNRVPKEGLEPSHPKAQEPKSCVSANSTTPAVKSGQSYDSAAGEERRRNP